MPSRFFCILLRIFLSYIFLLAKPEQKNAGRKIRKYLLSCLGSGLEGATACDSLFRHGLVFPLRQRRIQYVIVYGSSRLSQTERRNHCSRVRRFPNGRRAIGQNETRIQRLPAKTSQTSLGPARRSSVQPSPAAAEADQDGKRRRIYARISHSRSERRRTRARAAAHS